MLHGNRRKGMGATVTMEVVPLLRPREHGPSWRSLRPCPDHEGRPWGNGTAVVHPLVARPRGGFQCPKPKVWCLGYWQRVRRHGCETPVSCLGPHTWHMGVLVASGAPQGTRVRSIEGLKWHVF